MPPSLASELLAPRAARAGGVQHCSGQGLRSSVQDGRGGRKETCGPRPIEPTCSTWAPCCALWPPRRAAPSATVSRWAHVKWGGPCPGKRRSKGKELAGLLIMHVPVLLVPRGYGRNTTSLCAAVPPGLPPLQSCCRLLQVLLSGARGSPAFPTILCTRGISMRWRTAAWVRRGGMRGGTPACSAS